MMYAYFNPFVLPFVIGTITLFGVCIYKYIRWYRQFDRVQRMTIRKNILSFRILKAIGEMFMECLLHRRITRKNIMLGYMHRSIALGWFLLIVVGSLEAHLAIRAGKPFWIGIFYRYFVHNPEFSFRHAQFYANLMDLLLLYVLSGITLTFIKSIYSRIVGMRKVTKHVPFDLFTKYALWFIFPLRLFAESATATLWHNGGFLTQSIGDLISPETAGWLELPLWTLYSFVISIFLVSMPFSRYMHIFTEVPLIFFRHIGVTEGEKKSGYTMYELSACSRCGICIDNCPLNKDLDIKNVQPVYFLRDIRYKMAKPETADNCLMCGRCEVECPVGIDLTAIRRQMRDKKKLDTHDNYTYLNSIQTFNAIGRVGFFGGCMSHLTPCIGESMVKIFNAVGQKYWYIDQNRTICCGRPLYQQGYNTQAAELRRKNTQLINQSGIKLLITSCPICYQSFTKEYKLPIQVMHHTEYIDMLISTGKLKMNKSDMRISYHDPCELGRGCGIYEQPRHVLNAAGTLLQTANEGKHSLCCGHNLGDTVISMQQQAKVRDAARNNLLSVHPDLIATACPMCKKSFTNESAFPVKDVAEIVAEQIKS